MDTTGCSIQHITHLLDDILIIALWCGAYIIVMYEMPASSISTTKPHSVQYGILKKEKRAKLFIMNSLMKKPQYLLKKYAKGTLNTSWK